MLPSESDVQQAGRIKRLEGVAVKSEVEVIPGSGKVSNIIRLPQADYDALAVKDPMTLYITD